MAIRRTRRGMALDRCQWWQAPDRPGADADGPRILDAMPDGGGLLTDLRKRGHRHVLHPSRRRAMTPAHGRVATTTTIRGIREACRPPVECQLALGLDLSPPVKPLGLPAIEVAKEVQGGVLHHPARPSVLGPAARPVHRPPVPRRRAHEWPGRRPDAHRPAGPRRRRDSRPSMSAPTSAGACVSSAPSPGSEVPPGTVATASITPSGLAAVIFASSIWTALAVRPRLVTNRIELALHSGRPLNKRVSATLPRLRLRAAWG